MATEEDVKAGKNDTGVFTVTASSPIESSASGNINETATESTLEDRIKTVTSLKDVQEEVLSPGVSVPVEVSMQEDGARYSPSQEMGTTSYEREVHDDAATAVPAITHTISGGSETFMEAKRASLQQEKLVPAPLLGMPSNQIIVPRARQGALLSWFLCKLFTVLMVLLYLLFWKAPSILTFLVSKKVATLTEDGSYQLGSTVLQVASEQYLLYGVIGILFIGPIVIFISFLIDLFVPWTTGILVKTFVLLLVLGVLCAGMYYVFLEDIMLLLPGIKKVFSVMVLLLS